MGTRDHYLQRPQITIVFLSFALLAVPLSFLQLSTLPPRVVAGLMTAYAVVIGNTHFAITWALYLNSTNLGYFASSPGRRIVYFAVPPAILVALGAIGTLELPHRGTWLFVPFAVALALADYFHVVRQSFGVFEMFKARAGVTGLPRYVVRADNWYFLSLLALQLITFVKGIPGGFDGRFNPDDTATRIGVAAALILFVMVARGLSAAWRKPGTDRGALLTATGYLLLQSASALLVVYRSRLYLPSLAMHYVEYHVLMAPRLFQSDLDLSRPLDRFSSWLRGHKVVFYGALIVVGVCVSSGTLLALGGAAVTRDNARFGWLFVNLLNGIFLAHYFLEAFVWKFSNPFYRQTLAPIYFSPPAAAAGTRTPRGRRGRRGSVAG